MNYFKNKFAVFFLVGLAVLSLGTFAFASGGEEGAHGPVQTLLWMGVVLLFAMLGRFIEKAKQPSVLGELLIGVLLGNLGLIGISLFEPIKSDVFVSFLAELGVIILLFQVGLESNLSDMKKVGIKASLVAVVGVIVPFVLGAFAVGPWLLPEASFNAHLFLGAALTATSVGITARVFKDFGKLQTKEAQIVLGAAVIDDVLGLIILAVVSALVTVGAVGIGIISWIIAKAVLFLVGSVLIGKLGAPYISKFFSRINTGVGAKITLAIVFALFYSAVAGLIGLAPIVGAFAAGLILDPVHFKHFKKPKSALDLEEEAVNLTGEQKERLEKKASHYTEKHIEELLEPIGHFIIPIFFVLTGINVNLSALFDFKILLVALAITIVAFFGKYVTGFVAGKDVNKNIIGFGMVPRGEVGLIFATIGMGLGVLSDELFSVIVIMVIFTTLLVPPILAYFLRKSE
ncbi:MAG: cation:proton antiporter [Candidatus Paceibacterota bacterium]|jgi:Kef-type K+ transport system membrane component KefB